VTFITHECLSHVDFFAKATPKMKMINIQRHPVDNAYSLWKRGYGERYGYDSLAFDSCIDFSGMPVPWFADKVEYSQATPIDRVIRNVITLYKKDMETVKGDNVLQVSYEHFTTQSHIVTEKIERFLDVQPYENMHSILERECPRETTIDERLDKFTEMHSDVSVGLMTELVEISNQYENEWGLIRFL